MKEKATKKIIAVKKADGRLVTSLALKRSVKYPLADCLKHFDVLPKATRRVLAAHMNFN